MSVGEIKEAVGKLSSAELAEVSVYIAKIEAKEWDAQIDADFASGGRLAGVIEEVKADYQAGRTAPLRATRS